MRRAALTIGAIMAALLPVAAAVPPDTAAPPEIPVAITQPVGYLVSGLYAMPVPLLSEPGMIILVGSGLIGLASIVRRSTRA